MTPLFDMIRLNSFDSLWFWCLLALIWVLIGGRVLGVPWDMAQQMRRDAQVCQDVEILVRITSERHITSGFETATGLWACVSCALTVLGLLGFYYGLQLAQALFLLLAPLALVWGLSVRAAGIYLQLRPCGDALYRFLRKHRWQVQVITVVTIFVVSLWGGAQSIGHRPF